MASNSQMMMAAQANLPNMPAGQQYGQAEGNEEAANRLAKQGVDYAKQTMVKYRKEDAELWDLLTSLPRLNGPWPYICFVLNILLPGTGTMICSCLGYPGAWSKTQLTIGVCQMLTAVYIVGWIFSIYWGWLILQQGIKDKAEVQQFLNKTNFRSDQQLPA